MRVRNDPFYFAAVGWLILAIPAAGGAREQPTGREHAEAHGPAFLWVNPADLESRDLFLGPGGSQDEPHGPFTFLKEDLKGTSPKFDVKDASGVKWKVKLGIEARPETVATRLVWAVGYDATEDYFVPDLQVQGMPARLHRGQQMVGPNGTVHNVRLKREAAGEKKLGTWRWRDNAFTATREWNGLRALMAVINNWDLKDVNNAVYQDGGRRIHLVSDLGASFSCAGRCWPRDESKGDLKKYQESKFIRHVTADTVSFSTPARPMFLYLVDPKEYFLRLRLEWIGKNIPRADARWMGGLLSRLSTRQIHDAFRAAGYSPADVDAFSTVLERRIAALRDL